MKHFTISINPILKIFIFQLRSFNLKRKVLNEILSLFPDVKHFQLHFRAFGLELLVGKGQFGVDLLEVLDGVGLESLEKVQQLGGGGVGGFGWVLFGGGFESGVVGVCDFGKTAVAVLAWVIVKSNLNF